MGLGRAAICCWIRLVGASRHPSESGGHGVQNPKSKDPACPPRLCQVGAWLAGGGPPVLQQPADLGRVVGTLRAAAAPPEDIAAAMQLISGLHKVRGGLRGAWNKQAPYTRHNCLSDERIFCERVTIH